MKIKNRLLWMVLTIGAAFVLLAVIYWGGGTPPAVAKETAEIMAKQLELVRTVMRDRELHLQSEIHNIQSAKTDSHLPQLLFVSRLHLSESNDWQMVWNEMLDGNVSTWPDSYFEEAFAQLPLSDVELNKSYWKVLKDPVGNPLYAYMFMSKNQTEWPGIYVALIHGQYFADLMASFMGSQMSASIIDSKGLIVAHPRRELIGSAMKQSELIVDLTKNRRTQHFGNFLDEDRKAVFGGYALLDRTNLYVIETARSAESILFSWGGFFKIILGLVFILGLTYATITFVLMKWDNEIAKIQKIINQMSEEIKFSQIPEDIWRGFRPVLQSLFYLQNRLHEKDLANAEYHKKQLRQEKQKSLKEVSAGLSRQVKDSIAAVLGHLQLIKAKTLSEGHIQSHLDSIDRELKRIRDLTSGLDKFAGGDGQEMQKVDLNELIISVLIGLRDSFHARDIRVVRNFAKLPPVVANVSHLKSALQQILKNALEAVDGRDRKEIMVSTSYKNHEALLEVKDSGPGMHSEIADKMYEPFFTTKAGGHAGLGLSIVKGVLEEMRGQIECESEAGLGTTFTLHFPVQAGDEKIELLEVDEILIGQPQGKVTEVQAISLADRVRSTPDLLINTESEEELDPAFLPGGLPLPSEDGQDFKVRKPNLKGDI